MKFSRFLIPTLCVAVILPLIVLASGEWLLMRKVGALLVMPVGWLWILGLFLLFQPGWSHRFRGGVFVVWLIYSLMGSPYLGNALMKALERPFVAYESVEEPLDALVLLGGGTAATPGGNPALGTHGDRVLRPAVLFLEGKAGVLIATGRSITEKGEDRILSEETSQIWQSLGIPASAIFQLPDPRNTAEEMEEVAGLLKSHPEWERVGVCSSASHLGRAMKLAEGEGLDLIPVPSDFRGVSIPFTPLFLLPQGRGFRDVQTVLWETLGSMF